MCVCVEMFLTASKLERRYLAGRVMQCTPHVEKSFLSLYLKGCLPYVRRHITVNKMC